MRRNVKNLSVLWHKTKPIYEVLMATQPGQAAKWGQEISLLHKKHVHTAWCFHQLTQEDRADLIRSGFAQDAMAAIDKSIDEGLGLATATKKVYILFGSQTGTAESYAKMLGTYAMAHNITPVVQSLNDSVETLKNMKHKPEALIIVTSTYGTGEFPSNSQKFWKALNNKELTNLKDIPYTVFGLGNSHNEKFNVAAKQIDAALKDQGGKSFLRMQLSCELQANGHDATFRTWKRSIWPALGAERESGAVGTTYKITNVYGSKDIVMDNDHNDQCVRPGFFRATVHQNELLTPKEYHPHHRKLTIGAKTDDQKANFGDRLRGRVADITDHIEVLPKNPDDLVTRAAKRLGVDLNQMVEVAPLPGAPASFFDGRAMHIATILKEIIDLSAIPSRSLLELMATVATDAKEQIALQDLADNLAANSEYEKLTRGVFSTVDMLEMFPNLSVSLDQLISHCPHIVARTYSLANDNAKDLHEKFEIAYTTPTRWSGDKKHVGLCSGFMDDLRAGDHPWVRFIPSGIPLVSNTKPVFMLALGTGIGSIRAVLQHRLLAKQNGENVAPALVYYGFRHVGKDQLFVEDFAKFEAEGICKIQYVASHDTKDFITPMDKMDESVKTFLGADGEVLYCGLGGSVPLVVEAAMRRVGLDIATLRSQNRYHEEFFSPDLDMENLLKDLNKIKSSTTLADKFGKSEMFCMQCEQTYRGTGCHKVGVCGKTARVAALQDLACHSAKVLGHYSHHLRTLGAPENKAYNRITLFALFTTLTNVNFDEARFATLLEDMISAVNTQKAAYSALCKSKGVPEIELSGMPLPAATIPVDGLIDLGTQVGVLTRFVDPDTQSAAGVAEMLMYGLKGIAAYTDHSLMNGKEDQEIYNFMHKALAWLVSPKAFDLNEGLGLCLEAGKVNVGSMGLLYESNKTLGVPTPTVVPIKPVPGKSILVSGHDLIILKSLLELTEPLGINVYTHGEMLPGHSYPELKKHKNLIGNYGGAWMRQSIEFPHFPGPVLMTTNCLTEPHESYRDRIFTAGAVGWSGVPHCGDNMANMNFDALITAAKESVGFPESAKEFAYSDPIGVKRPETLTVGFGHETILSVAPKLIDEINKGNITRFFVVGGCDGFEGARSYYTDLVAAMPETAVVLTVGCGKYRINHLNLGTIGDTGIPRILDMGQCNDSFSAVQVALALADVLKCKVSDLPLSIVLSWFEQKAVAVLLSCLQLGLKPIHIGPALPAFVTPEVLDVLVKDFGLIPLGNPEEDLKKMIAAKGAS